MNKKTKIILVGVGLGFIWGLLNFLLVGCPDYVGGCRIVDSFNVYVPRTDNLFSFNTILFLCTLPTFLGLWYMFNLFWDITTHLFDVDQIIKNYPVMEIVLGVAYFGLIYTVQIIAGVFLGFLASLLVVSIEVILNKIRKWQTASMA